MSVSAQDLKSDSTDTDSAVYEFSEKEVRKIYKLIARHDSLINLVHQLEELNQLQDSSKTLWRKEALQLRRALYRYRRRERFIGILAGAAGTIGIQLITRPLRQ